MMIELLDEKNILELLQAMGVSDQEELNRALRSLEEILRQSEAPLPFWPGLKTRLDPNVTYVTTTTNTSTSTDSMPHPMRPDDYARLG